MHDLAPMTALGGTEPREDVVGSVILTEKPGIALASVAARLGQEKACREHLKDVIDAVPEPGKVQLHDPEAGFWMGPDLWMVGAPFDTHEDLADQLKARFGETASITEQTDAWVVFDLRGSGMEDVMERLCAIDIRAMETGDGTRTVIDHLGCFVLRRDPADWVRILGPRSAAGSLHHAILTAMHSAV
ncbi:sarcosine oxidase subunit gamma [Gymnodinialimonas ulvae]|uniref:sarcosine oxidase subunit gamma n=1 Tax=Gymnodinialimonas ulvae TaxID=3126504 RepID=UPI0030A1C71D